MSASTITATTGFDSDLSLRAKTAITWELTVPLVWTGSKGDVFVTPAGFLTDFASVPRFLHWLISPYGAYTRAAVLHDYLLWLLAQWYARGCPTDDLPPVTSRDADGIFRRVLQELGVGWAKRWVMWSAVRAGAACNPRRAYGRDFHKDLPKVLGMALLATPVVLPGVLGVLISLGFIRIVTLFRRLSGARRP